TPGGHAPAVFLPRTEGEVAWVLRECPAVLPVGAQSSLTGGATPFGEWVMSLARLDAIGPVRDGAVRAGAGVALSSLQDALRPLGLFYPPVPTFQGALVGGVCSTNAAGAATFKYGSTRDWVRELTVVLASGQVLDLGRGDVRARDGRFVLSREDGSPLEVPAPSYAMPRVAKRSAGYHSEPDMDLVDLFVGSEGTLGVITDAVLGVRPGCARLLVWAAFADEAEALAAVMRLRAEAVAARAGGAGLDVASIESVDSRCLELLREDGLDREHGVPLPPAARAALLFAVEPREDPLDEDTAARIDELCGPGVVGSTLVALPGDEHRAAALLAMREGVPLAVNRRIKDAQRDHPAVHKIAGDVIVPMDRLAEAMTFYRAAFARHGVDHALWGHVSDGNIHANAVPRTEADVHAGEAAVAEIGEAVLAMGGCPMSEHGVGRDPVKQALLRRLYGDDGIAQMRATRRALDPTGKLSPGVLFPRE
ncbi:MAG TPA: FAD-binding oxidoreductase, partial [Vicinamibacteria bacterium]|nr:FAD-binding oxidoreductase [Vicinamibacteria bacterium]